MDKFLYKNKNKKVQFDLIKLFLRIIFNNISKEYSVYS